MRTHEPTASPADPSNRIGLVGAIFGILGAAEGVVAALVFAWIQTLSTSPGLLFSMHVTGQDNGSRFTLVLVVGFVLAGVLALSAIVIKRLSQYVGIVVLLLGLMLTVLSILAGFSVGGFSIFGAIFVLLGGLVLVFAPRLQRT